MKKIILTLALVLSISTSLFAQAEGSTIGLRFGYPTEVSYQKGLNSVNRIELGFGFRPYVYATSLSVSGVYQWVKDLSTIANGLNWYYGGGAMVGFYGYSAKSYIPVTILGQVGLQYDLNIPLRLSLDWRPGFQFGGYSYNGFVGDGFCFGVRYIINK
jgi:hypothetical protein